jgi:hypothetical protein
MSLANSASIDSHEIALSSNSHMETSVGRVRKPQANSVGNKYKFVQQKKKKFDWQPASPLSADELKGLLKKIKDICECGKNLGDEGCFFGHFTQRYFFDENPILLQSKTVNEGEAAKLLLKCREQTRMKQPKEMESFLVHLFRESIVSKRVKSNGKSEFEMNYLLPGDFKVCRATFCLAYGFSVSKLKSISNALKDSPDGYLDGVSIRTWKDSKIHDLTYAQSEVLFNETFGFAGNIFILVYSHLFL